ncbi:hypothetical protein EGW08_008427, partial [Elysia chlorotica]
MRAERVGTQSQTRGIWKGRRSAEARLSPSHPTGGTCGAARWGTGRMRGMGESRGGREGSRPETDVWVGGEDAADADADAALGGGGSWGTVWPAGGEGGHWVGETWAGTT